MKKILTTLFLLIFALSAIAGNAYSNLKQENEYFCGPVSSANTIINIWGNATNNIVNELARLEKTTTNGTTINNLCSGIEKYLKKNKIPANVSYYGVIKTDKKYHKSSEINLDNIKDQGLINLGIYRKTGNLYLREEGHYVSLVGVKGNKLLILDPYNKNKGLEELTVKKEKLLVINKDKQEEFLSKNYYYEITDKIDYLDNDERMLINGVIVITPVN